MNTFNDLNKKAKIRFVIFVILLISCIFLAVYLSNIMAHHSPISETGIDTSEVGDVSIDGADFSWAVKLMGNMANAGLLFVTIIMAFLFSVFEIIYSVAIMLFLRFIGINKTDYVSRDEYFLTKKVYLIAIVVGLILCIIVTRFAGILPMLIFSIIWSLASLIYVLGVWERHKACEYSLQEEN